jgi:predicted secreted protein
MASQAQLGFKTLIKHGNASTGTAIVYTTVPEVIGDIDGPSTKRDKTEVTPHKTSDYFREYVPGMIDPGEIKFKMNYVTDDVTQAAIKADFDGGLTKSWQVEFPDASGFSFLAFPTEYASSEPAEDAITISVTLAITGVITEL